MSLYEHVYLARQDASVQQVEELTAHLKSVIEGMGGSIAKAEYWGVKSLSYRLRKNRKAHFTLLNLDAPAAAINEIERLERLSAIATVTTAGVTAAIGLTAATGETVRASGDRVRSLTNLKRQRRRQRQRRNNHGYVTAIRRGAPSVLPPP